MEIIVIVGVVRGVGIIVVVVNAVTQQVGILQVIIIIIIETKLK